MIREHVAIEEKEYIYSIDKICCYVNDDNRAYLQIVGWAFLCLLYTSDAADE